MNRIIVQYYALKIQVLCLKDLVTGNFSANNIIFCTFGIIFIMMIKIGVVSTVLYYFFVATVRPFPKKMVKAPSLYLAHLTKNSIK